MTILKEEINEATRALIDLAKWKLASVALLSAAGLGILADVKHFAYGYLLLFFVPYACAYIDFLSYERATSIHFIARFMRAYAGDDQELLLLRDYEKFLRGNLAGRVYRAYQQSARLYSSLVFGVGAPCLALLIPEYRPLIHDTWPTFAIPIGGIIWIMVGHFRHKKQIEALSDDIKPA